MRPNRVAEEALLPEPNIRAYARETRFPAQASTGIFRRPLFNSRLKVIYDIWLCSRKSAKGDGLRDVMVTRRSGSGLLVAGFSRQANLSASRCRPGFSAADTG